MFSDKAYKQLTDYINGETLEDENFDDNDLKQIYNALKDPGTSVKEPFNDKDYEMIYDMIMSKYVPK